MNNVCGPLTNYLVTSESNLKYFLRFLWYDFCFKACCACTFSTFYDKQHCWVLCVHINKTSHGLNKLETECFQLCETILSLYSLRSLSLRPQLTKAFDYNISQDGLKRMLGESHEPVNWNVPLSYLLFTSNSNDEGELVGFFFYIIL